MSDISIVSIQYDSLARLSQKLNEAILTLKKNLLKSQERKTALKIRDRSPLNDANDILHNFIKAILDEDEEKYIAYGVSVPKELIQHVRKLFATDPYFEQDIRDLGNRIETGMDLTLDHLETFDKMLGVVDMDREAVFRKLRRRR